jgi:hypothetical protein
MPWLKTNLLHVLAVLLLAALLGSELWLWSRGHEQARRALATLEQKKSERDRLASQSPVLNEENEQAIALDLANTRRVVAALHTALLGKDPTLLFAASPAKSTDLYFDLAAFMESTRVSAGRARVIVRPEEHFGFASHANEGPAADLVPAVFRQQIMVQYLIEALIESHPHAVTAVQREHPLTAAQRNRRNLPVPPGSFAEGKPAGDHNVAADFFEFDRQLSIRAPGMVDTEAFRLEFTGQTTALRTLLNSLAAFRLPVIVRSVEVEPLPAEVTMADRPAGAPAPMVSQKYSRFTVVVEVVLPPIALETPAS